MSNDKIDLRVGKEANPELISLFVRSRRPKSNSCVYIANEAMQLHIVKVSPCSRVVWLYCLRNKIPIDVKEVDLFAGKMKQKKGILGLTSKK